MSRLLFEKTHIIYSTANFSYSGRALGNTELLSQKLCIIPVGYQYGYSVYSPSTSSTFND